jgi:2-polyprenyl-6-methoxyphenol hydroxylase-like FAD-dependent oxidoreductase
VEYRFNESIESLDNNAVAVDVRFASGAQERFDIVIGADGLHSNTRKLAFGPEERFIYYLGYTFAGFTMPNIIGLSHGSAIYSGIQRMAALYGVKESDTLHAFFNIARDHPSTEELSSVEIQRRLMRETFQGDGWVIPQMLDAFDIADDVYFDCVSQMRMPRWSNGRVAVVGDAAAAPSFMTGQGSSVALVSAYVLAGELASHAKHEDGFAAYERRARPFVERNQANASFRGAQFVPNTPEEAEALRKRLGTIRLGSADDITVKKREAHNCLILPDYRDMECV